MTSNYCIIIPVYNHGSQLKAFLPKVQSLGYFIILVDDGSATDTAVTLDDLAARHEDIDLHRLAKNSGKGGAVMAGLKRAAELGYSHALQIDADGQHDIGQAHAMLDASAARPEALVVGHPIFDKSVNKLRFYARYLTHVWVWIETLSTEIKDSMCGFRIYPLQAIIPLLATNGLGRRMDFDPEILVRAYWADIPLKWVPVQVIYPDNGLSNFRPWGDNALISWMHIRLFFGMLLRLPKLLTRRIIGESPVQ
ncbi:MAG: glycosyltransferase family 2 protein [Sphingomonadales bacterium]|jgi:glycosyltransferase involved in cell wall biosynthesis